MTVTSLDCPACHAGGDAALGVIIRGVYDGVLFWECEACGTRWHRWPEGHWLRQRADPHVRGEPEVDLTGGMGSE